MNIVGNRVKKCIPGILLGYIDFAKNPAQRGNSSEVATLIVNVSVFVLDRLLLLDAEP